MIKLPLKNLRHSTGNTLFLAVIRIKESGIVFTLGDSEGSGSGDLSRVLQQLSLEEITDA